MRLRSKPRDFLPYLETVLEAFGANRLMIGSDWPVCTLSGDYQDVMGVVIDFTQDLSRDERADILGGTCARFYDVSEVELIRRSNVELGNGGQA